MAKKKKIEWFQLSQRQRMSPFPNYMSMESITREMKGVIGDCYDNVLMILKENIFWVFFDKNEYNSLGKKVLKKVLKNPFIFRQLVIKEKKFAKTFLSFIKHNRKNLQSLSKGKLIKIYQRYEKEYKRIYSHYFVVLTVENFLINYLKNYLDPKINNSQKAGQFLNILIVEPRAFVNRQEELAALKLTSQIALKKKWKNYFKEKNVKEIEKFIQRDKVLFNLIKKHEKDYFWITRDYEDPILTFSDFIQRFKKQLNENPQKRLLLLEKESKELIKKRGKVEKKLKLNKYYRNLFKAIKEGMYLKELRKSIVSQSLYYFDSILKEIGKRGDLNLNQVRHLTTKDIEKMLLQGKDYTNESNERMKLSVYWAKGGDTKIFTGKEAKDFYQRFLTIPKEIKKLRGFSASPGKVKGVAKIVMHPWEGKKLKKGDILVTAQAVPSFSPIIQRSAGLVADGGTGITSHSATLAREAGIPCVTGLKISTKVLKDGNKIEVDGDKGIVKIIK